MHMQKHVTKEITFACKGELLVKRLNFGLGILLSCMIGGSVFASSASPNITSYSNLNEEGSAYVSKAPKLDSVELSSTFTSSNEIEISLKTTRNDIEKIVISGWSGGAYSKYATSKVAVYDNENEVYKIQFQFNELVNTNTNQVESLSKAVYSFDAIVYSTNGSTSYYMLNDVQYTKDGFVANVQTDVNTNGSMVKVVAEKPGQVAILSEGEKINENTVWQEANAGENIYSVGEVEKNETFTIAYKAGEEINEGEGTDGNSEIAEDTISVANAEAVNVEGDNYKVGDNYYASLNEAITANKSTALNSEVTIEVVENVTELERVVILSDTKFLLNLSDKRVTSSWDHSESLKVSSDAELRIIAEKDGVIASGEITKTSIITESGEQHELIVNNGILTLDSGRLYTQQYSEIGAVCNLQNTTSATLNVNGGTIEISGEAYPIDNSKRWVVAIWGEGRINIAGGEIIAKTTNAWSMFGLMNNGHRFVKVNFTGGRIYVAGNGRGYGFAITQHNPGMANPAESSFVMSDNAEIVINSKVESKGIEIDAINQDVQIKGGNIILESPVSYKPEAVDIRGTNLIIGDSGDSIDTTTPLMRGDWYKTVTASSTNDKKIYFYDGVLQMRVGHQSGELHTGVFVTPENTALYKEEVYIKNRNNEDKQYISAHLKKPGWDISGGGEDDDVAAFLFENGTATDGKPTYRLEIHGDGATKDFAEGEQAPWMISGDYITEVNFTQILSGVTHIGDFVFSGLKNVTTITIPKTVTSIGKNPFCDTGIEAFEVEEGSTTYSVNEDGILLNKAGNKICVYPHAKLEPEEYTIMDGVTEIGQHAFYKNPNLEKVIIPSTVTIIGEKAFAKTSLLEEVYILSTSIQSVSESFVDMIQGSEIYTLAEGMVIEGDYTEGNTIVYYPPVINTKPASTITIQSGDSLEMALGITLGNPESVKYIWQKYDEVSDTWITVQETQGLTTETTSTYTIPQLNTNMSGDKYRWIVESYTSEDNVKRYPNKVMSDVGTSGEVTLNVKESNYEVDGKYYTTLEEAFAAIDEEGTVNVLQDVVDGSVTSQAEEVDITLNLASHTITRSSLMDIYTNLTIVGDGTITTATDGTNTLINLIRIMSKGKLTIKSGTFINAGCQNTRSHRVINVLGIYAELNINGGTIKTTLSDNIGETYSTGIPIYINRGTANIQGGEIINESLRGTYRGTSNTEPQETVAIMTSSKLAKLNVIDGTIINTTGDAISSIVDSQIIIGNSGDAIQAEKPIIQGSTYAINVTNGFEYYDGELRGKTAAYSGDIVKIPEDKVPYITEQQISGETYQVANLETGWNISATEDDNVWAFLIENGVDENGDPTYTLEVRGNGAIKDYEAYTDMPWNDFKKQITNLTFEENITKIGKKAFHGLENIRTVNLPEKLNEIGTYSFYLSGISGDIYIPKSVVKIGNNPFLKTNLTSITVSEENTSYKSDEDGVLYQQSGEKKLVSYPAAKISETYLMLDDTEKIGGYAFFYVEIYNVFLSEKVKTIDVYAFENSAIKEITIPQSVTTIKNGAFKNASNLERIYMKNQLSEYNAETFNNIAENAKLYTISKDVADDIKDANEDALRFCNSSTTIYYPPEITNQLSNVKVNSMNTATFEVDVNPGNEISEGVTEEVTYIWQVLKSGETKWQIVKEGQDSQYTTGPLTEDMTGYQYRCVLNTDSYNDQTRMGVIEDVMISNASTITVNKASYKVGINAYTTLQDAIEANPEGDEIFVIGDVEDNSKPVFPSGKTYILNLGEGDNAKTITKTEHGIVNNGNLIIKGDGVITTAINGTNIVADTIYVGGAAENPASLVINGGTIINTGVTENNVYSAVHTAYGNLEVNAGTLKIAKAESLTNVNGYTICGTENSGSITIKGGNVQNENLIAIYATGGETVKITGGTIEAKENAILRNDGTLEITGGHIKSSAKSAIFIDSDSELIIGTSGDAVSTVIPEIRSTANASYGVEISEEGNKTGRIKFYDGKISGKAAALYIPNDYSEIITPEGYGIQYNTVDGFEVATLEVNNYYVNTSAYRTLQDAIDACVEKDEVIITSNSEKEIIEDKENAIVSKNITLIAENTIKLDKLTINEGSSFYVTCGEARPLGTLEANEIVNYGIFELSGNTKTKIQNNAQFQIIKGTVNEIENAGRLTIGDSENRPVINGKILSKGTIITVNNGEINAGIVLNDGDLMVENGIISNPDGVAIINNGEGSAVVIESGIVRGSTYGIEMASMCELMLVDWNTDVSIEDPVIIGGTAGINTEGYLYFYDGIVKGGEQQLNANVIELPEQYHIKLDTEESGDVLYNVEYLVSNDEYVEIWDITKEPDTQKAFAGVKVISGTGVDSDTKYKLVIWGEGPTKDFVTTSFGENPNTPWFENYAEQIVEIELEESEKQITRYGNNIFANLTNVTKVYVLDSDGNVSALGNGVVVKMPDSLTEIGDYAFSRMTSLEGTFVIGSGVTTMGENPFAGASVSAFESDSTSFEVSENVGLYTAGKTRFIAYAINAEDTEYTVEESVTKVDSYAFYNATSLENIYLKVKEEVVVENQNAISIDGTFLTNTTETLIVYTEAKEIADNLEEGRTYNEGAKIYYPYKIEYMPEEEIAVKIREEIEITPTIRAGNPLNDVQYQWYFNDEAIANATNATYRKEQAEDEDQGYYHLVITNADGYYQVISEKVFVRIRDYEAPEALTVSVTYYDDETTGKGCANISVTASDLYSGVDKFYLDGVELTNDVVINSDGTGSASFDITSVGTGSYRLEVADKEGNTAEKILYVYSVEYEAGDNEEVTGSVASQLAVKGFAITIRENTFIKIGYTFNQWVDELDTSYNAGEHYEINSNMVLCPQWNVNEYTVSFYNNDGKNGEVLVSEKTYKYGTLIEVPGEQQHASEIIKDSAGNITGYKIYRHNSSWKSTAINTENSALTPVDITAANASEIRMIDSDVRYDAVYEVTKYNLGTATVYLDGKMQVSGETAILNREGIVFIGPMPQIIGVVENQNGYISN